VLPGFTQQGILRASHSSITTLCCQKPPFSVTALNLAESNGQEKKEGYVAKRRDKEEENRI